MGNASEEHLHALARHAFLRLWSYPSLYHRKATDDPRLIGKELCDLLLVFGSDVVIFSDKHCALDVSHQLSLSWKRWYKKAILQSAAQVGGAERWLANSATRLFVDPACKNPLPIRLPASPRFHRVLTVRGAKDAARSEWGGRGSLIVTNRPLDSCIDAPFRLGCFDNIRRTFHVFDENGLDAVLTTLDTTMDFITYLCHREALLCRPGNMIAVSEEDLLGQYMRHFDHHTGRHYFPDPHRDHAIFVDGTHWNAWLCGHRRADRDKANAISYGWDELIEEFSGHALDGTQEYASNALVADQETLLRWMSRETRFRRRVLFEIVTSMLHSTDPGILRRRYLRPVQEGEPYWVFAAFSPTEGTPYDVYRERRRKLLVALAYVVKHLHPDANDIVGLAFGGDLSGVSQDSLYLDTRDWSDQLVAEARRIHEVTGFFAKATPIAIHLNEYPIRRRDVEEEDV